jgi:primosomal protein N' (replication factor Y)
MSLFNNQVLQVALPLPLRKLFDYLYLEPTTDTQENNKPQQGQRVIVPFGRQTLVGVVIKVTDKSEYPIEKLKPIKALIENESSFNTQQLNLLHWAADYYKHPIGEVFASALPGILRENKTIAQLAPQALVLSDDKNIDEQLSKNATQLHKLLTLLKQGNYTRAELTAADIKSTSIKRFVDEGWASWQAMPANVKNVTADDVSGQLSLNTEQAIAVSAINSSSASNSPSSCFLLDGVTGSGKTEVYLQAIEHVLLKQQQVLVCVPEIGLTPQTISRFKQRFNLDVELWHSGMTDKQRFNTWYKARNGQAKIVIATRSGVFLPFADLGMIVIDEEHDASFKQQEGFKYHCRSLALYRAKLANVPVILGSATPSLETLQNALVGKFHHLELKSRAAGSQLPTMKLLDLNQCRVDSGIGEPLLAKIKQCLAAKQQVMLFINRRGFAPVLMCEECRWLTECSRCSSFTTFHKSKNLLICHHCGDQQPTVHQCGGCGSTRLSTVGVGTEQLHLALQDAIPDFPVIRLDRDSTSKKGDFEAILEKINKGEPSIIVGTQMVAKGHHFPNVSLVGIVDVDGSLFSSDFRAPEKLAQLIVQVSGRAGRGSIKGEVWLQTKFPEHPVIQDLVNNKYSDFASFALTEREMLSLPPYSYQALIRAEATNEEYASHWLQSISPHLNQFKDLLVLGPSPAPMTKKAGKFRHMLTIQCKSRPYLHKVVDWLIENLDTVQKDNRIRWSIDIDPLDLS